MKGTLPPRPTGSTPEARFMQWLWDNWHANVIQDSSSVKVNRTTKGIRLEAAPQSRGTSSNPKPVWL